MSLVWYYFGTACWNFLSQNNKLVLFSVDLLTPVLAELPPLVSESDLHIAQLALALLTSIASAHAQSIPLIQKSSLSQVLVLAESPLLQVNIKYIFYESS